MINHKDWSNELWNSVYRCKQCQTPYEAYIWIEENEKIVGREWQCNHCGYTEFILEEVQE